jgi:hypothetical protein
MSKILCALPANAKFAKAMAESGRLHIEVNFDLNRRLASLAGIYVD